MCGFIFKGYFSFFPGNVFSNPITEPETHTEHKNTANDNENTNPAGK